MAVGPWSSWSFCLCGQGTGSDEHWCLAHSLLSTQPKTPPREVGQPTLRLCLPIPIAQKLVSMVIPNPIKLPMNIHHHNPQGNRHILGLLSVCSDLSPLGRQSLLFPNQKCSLSRLVLFLSLQTLQCSWFQTYLHLELRLFKGRGWQGPRPDLACWKDSFSPAPQDALERFWADLSMLQN